MIYTVNLEIFAMFSLMGKLQPDEYHKQTAQARCTRNNIMW